MATLLSSSVGRWHLAVFVGVLTCLQCATAFYLPGVAPQDFKERDPIPLKVNKLTSTRTHIPYGHYTLAFCQPDEVKNDAENLGEYLTGEMIQNSPYQLSMFDDVNCKLLCRKVYSKEEVAEFIRFIHQRYYQNWIVDNLPAATETENPDHQTSTINYEKGIPIGAEIPGKTSDEPPTFILYNHVKIVIDYHVPKNNPLPQNTARVVGVRVERMSIKHNYNGKWSDETPPSLTTCSVSKNISEERQFMVLQDGSNPKKEPIEVIWTYDVAFEPSDTEWPSRWDIYLSTATDTDGVQWFSIVNSVLIVLFLAGMVGMILMRTLHKDINRYNRIPTEEERAEEREESGWKLVHADVFRPPTKKPMLFCVYVGTGVQLLGMATVTLVFASIGFLSPANRGALMTALLLVFVLMGTSAGYNASRTYKMFKGKQWQRCTLYTAILYPATVFSIFFVLNLILWAEGSAAAVPFGSMFAVLVLWFGISVPLVFMGAWMGFKKPPVAFPVATSNIPRPIPQQPWYMGTWGMALIGGILPFGAVFVELVFILTSLWLDKYYYFFGFLLLVFAILLVTCAEITIVLVYFQLCSEDYHWWWRSFITSGSCGILVFVYSVYYFFARLNVDLLAAAILYFGYMFCISYSLFILTGTVGYKACFWFTRKIYGSIKVD